MAPASAYWLANEYYKTDEEFVYALADVLHEEYQAIIDSGAFLQVDDAVLMHELEAGVVGRERIMAGTDCGFAQGTFTRRVHEEIQWAKLASLAEGAAIASRELWGPRSEA